MNKEDYENWLTATHPEMKEIFDIIEEYNPLFTEDAYKGNIGVGKGWIKILRNTVIKLAGFKNTSQPLKIVQIKEKFGKLRIYTNFSTEEIEAIIDEAETEAEKTCEECGSTEDVRLIGTPWLKTLCLSCRYR